MNCYTGFDKNLTKILMFYVQCLDISSSPNNARKKFFVLKNSQSSFHGVVVLTFIVYWNTVKYILCLKALLF